MSAAINSVEMSHSADEIRERVRAAGVVGAGGAVVCDSASSAAKACVGACPGFELTAAVFARFHVSYCNA